MTNHSLDVVYGPSLSNVETEYENVGDWIEFLTYVRQILLASETTRFLSYFLYSQISIDTSVLTSIAKSASLNITFVIT